MKNVQMVCDRCDKIFHIKGVKKRKDTIFELRIKYAKCTNCGYQRNNSEPLENEFRCKECNIITSKRTGIHPVMGMCRACYQGSYLTSHRQYDIIK